MSDWLGMGAAPRSPRSGMKERVLARALTPQRRWSRRALAIAAVLVLALGAGGYWYMLPPNQRPPLGQIKNRVMSFVDGILNTPVSKSAQTPQNAPANNSKNPASSSSENTGLLSN